MYYRCRHAYDKNTGHQCSARYVRGDRLELAVWEEVKRVLANPIVVLQELERRVEKNADQNEITSIESELANLVEREKKLVRLYTLGTLDEQVIKTESEEIGHERSLLEQKLSSLRQQVFMAGLPIDQKLLAQVCASIAHWLEEADKSDQILALEALQVAVEATRDLVIVSGVLPTEKPGFIIREQSCPCLSSGDELDD
jgi:site-specific DNA recombinase